MTKFDETYEKALQAVKQVESGALDAEARGSCQACFKPFVVKPRKGSEIAGITMVKHGYQRPGYGYLVGECWGVGHPPFELSCELTKVWRKHMVEHYIPAQKKLIKDIKEKRVNTFPVTIYVHQGGRTYSTAKKIRVTEGEALPAEWVAAQSGTPNFDGLRKSRIIDEELVLASMEKDLVWLTEKIKSWRYAPDLLAPKEKPRTEGQTIRAWLYNPKTQAELLKLPSPNPNRGKNFLDWANSFPHTMGYVSMNGNWKPGYYAAVRSQYEKITGAAPLAVERDPRERAVVSREQAEKEATRAAKLAKRERVKAEKAERATKRDSKAVEDVRKLTESIAKAFGNELFIQKMKERTGYTREAGVTLFDSLIDTMKRYGLIEFVGNKKPLQELLIERSKRLSWSGTAESLRSDLKMVYTMVRDAARESGLKV